MRYTSSQARTHLSRLIREAQAGEEVVIIRGSKDIVRVVPLTATEIERYAPRKTAKRAKNVDKPGNTPLPDAD